MPSDPNAQQLPGVDNRRLLEITRDACIRLQECRTEMGLSLGNPEPVIGSWAWKRRCYRSEYAGHFYHRIPLGGHFAARGGNLSLAIPARFTRQLAAKHVDDIVGTDPFIAVMPAKSTSDTTPGGPKVVDAVRRALSKQVEAKAQEEISRSNVAEVLAESIRVALTENERPIKLTWVVDRSQRPELRAVAVYPAGGSDGVMEQGSNGDTGGSAPIPGLQGSTTPSLQDATPPPAPAPTPIRTPSGSFIFDKADFVITVADADGTFRAPYLPNSPVPEGQILQLRLRSEPAMILGTGVPGEDGNPVWSGEMLDPVKGSLVFATIPGLIGTDTHRDRLEAAGLKMEDFIYDIKAPTLDDSDIQCHVYDEDLSDVLAAYGVAQDPAVGYETQPDLAALMAGIRETTPLSGASQGKREAGERPGTNGSQVRKVINVHETYYRVRVNPGDKHKTWLFLVIDLQRGVPLYATYLGNMRMKKPPFRLLRGLESEPGRAYGVGVYQKFDSRNLAVDFWFNAARLKTTKDRSADFVKTHAFKNAKDAQGFELGTERLYELASNAANGEDWSAANPPVFRVNLHEVNEKEWELIEKLIQTGMLEFGIVSIGELASEGAGIAKGGTATATRNIERSGNLVQRSTENMMAGDITALMEMAIDIILENADLGAGSFTDAGDLLAGLNRDEIRDLPRDVRLLLTKARSAESLETNTQVKATIIEYYQMPKWLQAKCRFAYINILKSLDVQDADEVLTAPTEKEIAAEQEALANPPSEQPHESVSIKMADLLPTEAAQALEKLNIKPDPARQQGATFAGAQPTGPGQSDNQTGRQGDTRPAAGPHLVPKAAA